MADEAEASSNSQSEQDLHGLCANPKASEDDLLELIDKNNSLVTQTDDKGRLPLHYLAIEKMLSIDKSIAAQPLPDTKLLPLHILCRHNATSLQSVSALLESHPQACESLDDFDCLPLHFACSGDADVDVVQLLLKANPNASKQPDGSGWLPHHYTARCGTKLDVLRTLLKANPDGATTESKDGLMPLDCLGQNPDASEEFLRALLEL